MTSGARFSCFLIGADTLLLECVDILLSEGHDVRGVITATPRIADACAERDVAVLDLSGDYAAALAAEPFDHLFAVTHLAIIPDEVLSLPGRGAINFHDGPLPRYAGLNAPVWALLNREQSYGISWHVMTSGVDSGDLLKQTFFEVSPAETALSLNTRCMAAALETFPGLVRELAEERVERTWQDPAERTYFGKFQRPPAACMVDWSASAAEIDAFVRGLTFGQHPNPIGVPNSCLADRPDSPFVISSVEIVTDEVTADSTPGQVIRVDEQGAVVATDEGTVAITAARTLSGVALSPGELASDFGLEAGKQLAGADSEVGRQLTELGQQFSRTEDFWSKRLTALETPEVPQARPSDGPPSWSRAPVEVPASFGARFGVQATEALLAAFGVYLARTGRKERFHLALVDQPSLDMFHAVEAWYSPSLPLEVSLDSGTTFEQALSGMTAELDRVRERNGFLRDLVLRQPSLTERAAMGSLPVGVLVREEGAVASPPASLMTLSVTPNGTAAELIFDSERLSPDSAEEISAALSACLSAAVADPTRQWSALDLVSTEERLRQLEGWNQTATDFASDRCVHQLFEDQVDRTPEDVALVFGSDSLTYRELDEHANRLAHFLLGRGVGPDSLVGVHVERSLELLIATLGVMKAGGAYVPLDPSFPNDRVAFMVADSGARVLISRSDVSDQLLPDGVEVVRINEDGPEIFERPSHRPVSDVGPANLAYAIYTSGSTGAPKGVLVEHRNVANFFTGMDAVVEHDPLGTWLAVTSLSFDISVLELFWTLARGFKVVVYQDVNRATSTGSGACRTSSIPGRAMDFGLFMWGNDDGPGPSKYRLMLEASKYFDQNGFSSAWTPERHFHSFGGPFPNPSVTSAAIAAVTKNIAIRSGSCVSPLHHPIRIAEEWAVVDNLSNGRVGLSFAAGWQPNDFVIRPESYPDNKKIMLEQIDVVRRLWRGEAVEFDNPEGEAVSVTTLPRPVQAELPFWLTTAGNPESYRLAGSMGANLLTHLLGQSVEEVAQKIAIYRAARAEAGLDPAAGVVTLMLHAFVGTDDEEVREIVRQPMKDYLGASMKLVLGFAWSFPAFKRPGGPEGTVDDVDLSTLSDEETEAILDFAFERYFETSGLFGTPESCLEMVDRCKEIDVDEIACLLDFGVDTDLVLDSLPHLKTVRDAANPTVDGSDAEVQEFSFRDEVHRHEVTHLQCTPSMARMLMQDERDRAALKAIRHLMIGGEAFPPSLARELAENGTGTLTNMYGPTETTIWSSTHRLDGVPDTVPIGHPIANTRMYVLDRYRQPLPPGVPGDLYIGGEGVTRGYHERPELTGERFVPDPFYSVGSRMYWTGDLARFDADGILEFLGRIDHQVKVRGYRIELGEVEARVSAHPAVRVAAVVLSESRAGDQRLIAYVVPDGATPEEDELRAFSRMTLPDYMLPAHFVALERMPLTPNGKIDRAALAALEPAKRAPRTKFVEPANDLERAISECWCSTLGVGRVGVEDNFFDIGGHSLLVVQLHRAMREAIEHPVSLVDLYRFPTVHSLAGHLMADAPAGDLQQSTDRAARRREVLATKRRRRG